MSTSSLWQHLGFRRLYLSSISFALGTQIYQLALPLIFYELTRSPTVMTGLRAVELLPNLLLAMFIGVWVDRVDRGRWARRAMSGMVVLMGLQALLLPQGAAMLPLFFVSAFALMSLNYLYAICRMGLVKEMLPEPLLLPATGQLTVISQVAAVLGPALAGALVAWQMALGLWLPMAALLLAAALLRGIDLPARPFVSAGYWQDWREGWRVLRANRPLWQLSWWVVLINGSAGVVEVLFLFRARDELQIPPATLGLLYGLAGLGGICGGLLCSRLRGRLGLGRLLMSALALEAASILMLAWGEALALLVCGMALNSFAMVLGNVCVWGYRQESTASAHIGRVSGLTGSLFKLLMPLALLASGQLASHQALGALLAGCAGLHLLACLGLRCSAIYRVP
ncbi:MFS family permease [Paucibacter oligotrophus]|uniref:MFS family permease n=1 Tax=Roseateles oligotrophus TaxID=1769250 RepID=A0A840LAB6_9BURK|nr:MFS transporter [Roseateles oligotrophus]MBB4844691.1 MFS family permease [Roseateles oligotrophus]